MSQPLIELAGEYGAPILHLAPANGFQPQTYLPMLRAISGYRSLCLPPRALWGDQMPPSEYRDWSADADDLLAGLAAHDMQDVVAVGHSLGGVISMLALIKEPQRFKALIMLDPPILLPDTLEMIRSAWEGGVVDLIPLVQGARRRCPTFDSREDAFARFRGKRLFADWSDEALWLYLEHGIQPCPNDTRFELSWSIEWEAHYFSTVYQRIWEDLPRLNGLAPTLLVRGGESDTFVSEAFERARSLATAVMSYEMTGQGHLFPQAAPGETAKVIEDWLRSL